MEAKNADLSALRINRSPEPPAATSGTRRALRIAVGAVGAAVLVGALLLARGALRSAVEVRLVPATMVSQIGRAHV